MTSVDLKLSLLKHGKIVFNKLETLYCSISISACVWFWWFGIPSVAYYSKKNIYFKIVIVNTSRKFVSYHGLWWDWTIFSFCYVLSLFYLQEICSCSFAKLLSYLNSWICFVDFKLKAQCQCNPLFRNLRHNQFYLIL